MNLNHLSRFEQLAQQLLEGSFSRLFGGQLLPADIATHLAATMEVRFQSERQESHVNPDSWVGESYSVRLHPKDFGRLQETNPHLHEQLAEYLVMLAAQAGQPLPVTPVVHLVADPSIKRNQVLAHVDGSGATSAEDGGITQVRVPNRARLSLRKLDDLGAFVIIGGKRHVPLDRPLMTVGRQLDNDIVIDNPTVSRQHAQLRWRYGRFMLYDMGGKQGTSVNGRLITEHVLQAGDVILVGAASLVYGEDPVELGTIEAATGNQKVLNESKEITGHTKPLPRGDKS